MDWYKKLLREERQRLAEEAKAEEAADGVKEEEAA
jgi:hypothetical protein